MEMKKKVVEQSKLVKLKESSDQKVGKLVHEIQVSSDFLQCCPMKGRVLCESESNYNNISFNSKNVIFVSTLQSITVT